MFTNVLVLGLVLITFRKFSTMYVRACESFPAPNEQYCHIIQVSTHVEVDRSKSGCHDACISQSIQDLCITHIMVARRPTHYQYRISAICNPGNGNKTLVQNDCNVIHPMAKAVVFTMTYSLIIRLDLKQFQKTTMKI